MELKPFKITSKRNGKNYYMEMTDGTIHDIKTPSVCNTVQDLRKHLKTGFFIRTNNEWRGKRFENGVACYYAE